MRKDASKDDFFVFGIMYEASGNQYEICWGSFGSHYEVISGHSGFFLRIRRYLSLEAFAACFFENSDGFLLISSPRVEGIANLLKSSVSFQEVFREQFRMFLFVNLSRF